MFQHRYTRQEDLKVDSVQRGVLQWLERYQKVYLSYFGKVSGTRRYISYFSTGPNYFDCTSWYPLYFSNRFQPQPDGLSLFVSTIIKFLVSKTPWVMLDQQQRLPTAKQTSKPRKRKLKRKRNERGCIYIIQEPDQQNFINHKHTYPPNPSLGLGG